MQNISTKKCNNAFALNKKHDLKNNKIFGFWIYLMSDCILFATLFATYSVMVNNTANGVEGKDFFKLPFVFLETVTLLLSSLTYGFASICMKRKNKYAVITWLILTVLLGTTFIGMELNEFHQLIIQNINPNRSGFLSAFFTLVGTHGLHVIAGILWILVLIFQITSRDLTKTNSVRIICLGLFWHFLDIIWICVFTLVYLLGMIA